MGLLAVALAAALLGAGATATVAPAQVRQTAAEPKSITVAGEAETTATPDVAYVTVGVQTQSATAAEATGENSRLMTAVLNTLRGRGVRPQDLRTSGLYVMPQYERNRTEVVGYEASNNVTVTVNEVERAGELLDAALGAGANRVAGLRFDIRDTAGLRQQVLADAARSARARADALAAGLGLRVVGVSSVQEEAGYFARPAVAGWSLP